MVVTQVPPPTPQVAAPVHPDMEALHQSMMTFCQTAMTALAEQQRLAAEMRETLAKIQELSAVPETVPEVPELGEVGGRLSPTPSPRGASRQEKPPAPAPDGRVGCPEGCLCMGVTGLCGPHSSGNGLRLDLVGEEGWEEVVAENHSARMTYREPLTPLAQEEEDDEGGYSTDGYTPRSDDGEMEHKMRGDKYTARWGVTHGGHKINYDEPVYTPDGNGMRMPRGVFQDSGWGGWGDDIAVGDIVRTFPLGGICEKTKQYGIVTLLKNGGEEKRVWDAFVVDIIMFIPEMERELNSTLKRPITGMCGYKIGLQKTFSTQSRMAKLV